MQLFELFNLFLNFFFADFASFFDEMGEEFIIHDTPDNDLDVPIMDGQDLDREIRNIIGDVNDDLAATMQDNTYIESDEEFEALFQNIYNDEDKNEDDDTHIESDEEFEALLKNF